MQQMARNATDEGWGYLDQRRYVLHDRDTKFCASFRTILAGGGIKAIVLPARSPNLKAYVSYCPLSRLCKGESWLLGPSTSVTLNNGVLVQRFV